MCDPACIKFGTDYLKEKDIQNKEILEVGSYNVNGSLRQNLLEYKPKRYIGVDMVGGPDVDEICNAYDIITRYGKESFDVVLSTEMMEHVENWQLVISNFKNIIRPGGIIVITTRSIGFSKHNYPYDFWRFEPKDMNFIFQDCLIEAIERDPYAPGIFIKVKKPLNFHEVDLSNYKLYDIRQ